MAIEYIFVSCDIISHSAEPSLERQRDNIAAINKIVEHQLHQSPDGRIIWASGGDGGHVAYPVQQSNVHLAIQLACELRLWSIQNCVNLRITGNSGKAESIQGADGRTQLVGPGINLTGRLLPFGDQSRIILTDGFLHHARIENDEQYFIHDEREINPTNLPSIKVFLLSLRNQFQSTWYTKIRPTDRQTLKYAIEANDTFEVIYRSKKLLDINPNDNFAQDALQMLPLIRKKMHSNFIHDFLYDESFVLDVVRASTLIERRFYETICEEGDHGTTMFLILKGQIGVIFQKSENKSKLYSPPPDFIMYSGDLVGELAFALNRRRTATLICLEETALLAFDRAELEKKINITEYGSVCLRNLDRKLRTRVIENFWNRSGYFPTETVKYEGMSEQSTSEELVAPWLKLVEHAELDAIYFENVEKINISDYKADFSGLSVLASGQIQSTDKTRILNGEDYPILLANFQQANLNFREEGNYTLKGDIKILNITKNGFKKLGGVHYDKIIDQLTDYLSKKSKIHSMKLYDVFISYNSKDREIARQLGDKLQNHISVWFDEWEIRPGSIFQSDLEKIANTCKSAIILIGYDGLGKWEEMEIRALLSQFVDRKIPIIPVLLPDASNELKLPTFLYQFKFVNLRSGINDAAIKELLWGITGIKSH